MEDPPSPAAAATQRERKPFKVKLTKVAEINPVYDVLLISLRLWPHC